MRILTFVSSIALVLMLFTTTSPLTSCTKEVVIRDTVTLKDTLTIRDTITIKDTITIIDSSCANCYDLKKGLIAYYDFNDGALNDLSGKNNHIVFNNATKTADRFGTPNNAYFFNGSSSYMRVPHDNSFNTTEITLNAKVKAINFYVGPCSINNIFSKGSPDNVAGYFSLRIGNYDGGCELPTNVNRERFSGALQGTGINSSDTFFVKTDVWYDATFTYDGEYSRIYINGQLKNEQKILSSIGFNSQDLYIGKHNSDIFPYWFNGIMDEIRIYNRALCEAEVKALNSLKN